jgi:hypothetical protein
MWEPLRLTTLWAFTDCYKGSFTFTFLPDDDDDDDSLANVRLQIPLTVMDGI